MYVLPKIFTRDELILIDSDPQTVKLWITQHTAEEEEVEPLVDDKESQGGKTDATGDLESQHVDSPQKRRRVKRAKTKSCPTGTLMFSEEPSALGPQLKPQMIVGNAGMFMMNTPDSDEAKLEGMDLAKPENQQQPRRSRPSREERRTLSCPVANNAFFQVELVNPGHVEELPTLNESRHSQHSEW